MRRSYRFGWIAAAVAAVLGVGAAPAPKSAPSPAPPRREIRGTVTDIEGKPLARAVVLALQEPASGNTLSGKPVRADSGADGAFVLKDLPDAAFALRVSAEGFEPVVRRRIPAGSSLEINLGRGSAASGVVLDIVSRRPVAGATVLAWDAGAAPFGAEARAKTVAGADGAFRLSGLPRGILTVEAAAPGFSPVTFERVAVPLAHPPFEILLDSGPVLKVRLLDPAGKPVRGAEVEAEAEAPPTRAGAGVAKKPAAVKAPSRGQVTSGGDGAFTIRRLPAGTFTVRLLPDGFGAVTKPHVKLEGGKTTDLGTVAVPEGPPLAGRVTAEGGIAVVGAEIAASWGEGSQRRDKHARSGADGGFTLPGASGGPPDRIVVRAKGFAVARRDRPALHGGLLDVQLERPGTVIGKAELPGGTAPSSLRAAARRETAGSGTAGAAASKAPVAGEEDGVRVTAEGSGSFRIEGLEPGMYTIEAATAGKAPAKKTGVRVVGGETVDVGTLTLDTPAGITGRVLDGRTDAPVGGAAIRVESLGGASFAGRATSGADGTFSVEGSLQGSFAVTVQHPAYAPSRVTVDVQPDKDAPEVVVRLTRGGTLTGTVFDSKKQGVPNVSVVVTPIAGGDTRTVVTGPDGRYFSDMLPGGTYTVAPQSAAGAPQGSGARSKSVVIVDGETATVDFDTAARIALHGRVLRGDTPVANAFVLLTPSTVESGGVKSFRADPQGAYQIDLDHPGAYQASVQLGSGAGSAGQTSIPLNVPDLADVPLDIVLPVLSISGHVTDTQGNPVRSATITAARDAAGAGDPARAATATTAADGSYKVDGLDPGTFRVTARAAGFRSAEQYPVVLQGDPSPTVDLTLDRGWILRGRLTGPQGQPIPGAMVIVAAPGQAESGSLPTTTDGAGSFKIAAPVDGPASVTAIANGFAPAVAENVPPAADSDPPVQLVAGAGGTVRIRVLTPDGAPVVGARLALLANPLFPGSDFVVDRRSPPPTDAEGNTTASFVLPREYTIIVTGRPKAAPVRITVTEGAETDVTVTAP